MTPAVPSTDIYTDFNRFSALRALARDQSPEALREVAGQFESLYLQMMLKSMREASFGDGLMDNEQTRFYRDMHDQQLSLHLAKSSNLGLADLIIRQLEKPERTEAVRDSKDLEWYRTSPGMGPVGIQHQIQGRSVGGMEKKLKIDEGEPIKTPEDFIKRLMPYARQAAEQIGADPKILLAQAALETGWGKAMIRHGDGNNSYNLFGIKADKRWSGDRVSVSTLEFRHGVAEKRRAHFRSYAGFKESFDDYVRFLKTNGRYREALKNSGDPHEFIKSLHDAGYATDPDYAKKVLAIFGRGEFARPRSSPVS